MKFQRLSTPGVLALVALVTSACTQAAARADANSAMPPASPTAAVSRYVMPGGSTVAGLGVGEVSGLAWDADEQLLYAVSDQGKLIHLRVERAGSRLISVKPVTAMRLAEGGKPAPAKRFNAEGLAVQHASNGRRGDSQLVVALEEKPPQIARFSPEGALLQRLAVPPPADDLANYRKKGRGLESVVMHPAHGVTTAPEAPLKDRPDGLHTVYAKGQAWSFARHAPDSRLKGLDVLPDGSLVVLERSRPGASKDRQVASLRRVDIAACDAGGVCAATLLAALPVGPENFEGLTLLDARHALIASDNGGLAGQGTTFVLVTLP